MSKLQHREQSPQESHLSATFESLSPADAIDPLLDTYHASVVDHPDHRRFLKSHETALLSIDLQYLDAARDCGIFSKAPGVSEAPREFYFRTLEEAVLPNVRRLQDAFRSKEMEVIHVRICSLTQDGRDRSSGHKRLGILAAPGSLEAEFLPEIAPREDEIVINKTTSGVFPSTNLHYVLTNLGIRALFVAGVYTNECVETTVRDACDLGYLVTMVEDACTTVTPELHEASIATLKDRYARILTTDQALLDLNGLGQKREILAHLSRGC